MNVDVLQVVMVIMIVQIIMIMVLFTTTKSSKNNDLANLGKRKNPRQIKKQTIIKTGPPGARGKRGRRGKVGRVGPPGIPGTKGQAGFPVCEHHEQHHHPMDIRASWAKIKCARLYTAVSGNNFLSGTCGPGWSPWNGRSLRAQRSEG